MYERRIKALSMLLLKEEDPQSFTVLANELRAAIHSHIEHLRSCVSQVSEVRFNDFEAFDWPKFRDEQHPRSSTHSLENTLVS